MSFFVQKSIFDPAGSGFALALVSWMLVFGCWFLGLLFYRLHGWRLCFSNSFFSSLCQSVSSHIPGFLSVRLVFVYTCLVN